MVHKQILELLNPVRIKIIQRVSQRGDATSKELSEFLPDVPIASLYRHVKKLIDIGVLEVVSEVQIRGTLERRFKLRQDPFDALEKEMDAGDADLHYQLFFNFLMSQLSDFSDYLSEPGYNMKADLVGFRTYPLYLSEAESQAFIEDLGQLLMKYASLEAEPERKLRKFSFTTMPIKTHL